MFDPETRFSFWKPEPIPPNDAWIVMADLQPLGSLRSISAGLLQIPHMLELPSLPFPLLKNEVKLVWDVAGGLVLDIRVEEWPPKPGEILTIGAKGIVPDKAFYRLYVQVFERLGVTVLDDRSHHFYTPKEFRTKVA